MSTATHEAAKAAIERIRTRNYEHPEECEADLLSVDVAGALDALLADHESTEEYIAGRIQDVEARVKELEGALESSREDRTKLEDERKGCLVLLNSATQTMDLADGIRDVISSMEHYKRDCEECGKAVGCAHPDDGHARCVGREFEALTAKVSDLESQLAMSKEPARHRRGPLAGGAQRRRG